MDQILDLFFEQQVSPAIQKINPRTSPRDVQDSFPLTVFALAVSALAVFNEVFGYWISWHSP